MLYLKGGGTLVVVAVLEGPNPRTLNSGARTYSPVSVRAPPNSPISLERGMGARGMVLPAT